MTPGTRGGTRRHSVTRALSEAKGLLPTKAGCRPPPPAHPLASPLGPTAPSQGGRGLNLDCCPPARGPCGKFCSFRRSQGHVEPCRRAVSPRTRTRTADPHPPSHGPPTPPNTCALVWALPPTGCAPSRRPCTLRGPRCHFLSASFGEPEQETSPQHSHCPPQAGQDPTHQARRPMGSPTCQAEAGSHEACGSSATGPGR